MNNKYSVACITLVRGKYTVRLHGAPCSSLDGVTACVVYTAIRFEIRFEHKKTIRMSLCAVQNWPKQPKKTGTTSGSLKLKCILF